MKRREFLRVLGATGAAALAASCNQINSVVGTSSSPANLVRFPEKTEMILLTDRPPQLETPIHYFRQDLTPNEAFFVRWHLEGIPTSVDLRTFRLNVTGHVGKRLQLSVDDLRSQFEPISIIAVTMPTLGLLLVWWLSPAFRTWIEAPKYFMLRQERRFNKQKKG
jgi:sulfite dehydrogenase (cytochrome) subunit A